MSSEPPKKNESESHHKKRFEEFFAAFGYAITRWAHVDRSLFHFCRFALSTTVEKMAIVFYRSQTIGDHLTLVDSLLKVSLSKRRLKQWDHIYKMTQKHLPFRNELAHNPPVKVAHITAVRGREDRTCGTVVGNQNRGNEVIA
jgi:hypothetical protein